MSVEVNNFWKLTKSQKFTKSSYIVNMFATMIDNNQNIKRLVRYMTINPMAKKSHDKNGNMIIQKDLNDSLLHVSDEIKNNNAVMQTNSTRSLFTMPFNKTVKTQDTVSIFVHESDTDYRTSVASAIFSIEICVPDTYVEIQDENELVVGRQDIIASLIDDMIGDYTVDNEYGKILGNIDFNLISTSLGKLNESSDVLVRRLVYECHYPCSRISKVYERH